MKLKLCVGVRSVQLRVYVKYSSLWSFNLALINIYNTMPEKTNEFNNPYSSLPPGRKNDQGKYENGSKTCQKVSF